MNVYMAGLILMSLTFAKSDEIRNVTNVRIERNICCAIGTPPTH